MPDNQTMDELLQAPTEGYGDVIVILEINADHFEIKTNLLQLVQANPYHGFERENPHIHINTFKRITSTLKFRDVPNDVIRFMMFPYSLEGAARAWYDKEPPNSILTWEDLVNKFVNQFFPPSKTTHLKNEISRFTQRFEKTFGEVWERFKEMLRANLLSKTTKEALNIIENKLKVRYSRNKPNVSRMNINSRENASKMDDRIDKLADQISTLVDIFAKKVVTLAPVKAVEESCELEKVDFKILDLKLEKNQASTSGTLPSNAIPNPKGEMKTITTRNCVAYEGHSIPSNHSPKKVVERETEDIKADDQAIQTILLGLPEDIYAAVDSCETAQEIWFTSNDEESIKSYYHCFLKLMNDSKRNKHFPEKIASNLKFLNNLQPEWSQHVTIVHQTKDLHTADYTQLYDFLKYNKKEVDDPKAERLSRNQDPLALMANSNNSYAFPALYQDQPSFNQNYMQQPMPNPEDITNPTTAMNMELTLMAKAFKLNYSTPTNNKHMISSNPPQNPRVQNVGNQNGLIVVPGTNQNSNGNEDLDEIEEVDAKCILMANLQQASTSGTQADKAPVYDSDGLAEYIGLLKPIPEPLQVPQNDNVISEVSSVKQRGETVEHHPANVEETRVLYDSLYQNLAIEVEKVNTVNRKWK
nr:reverse transcriptase domain-containing protein [Tanacetum cinerariifolium]